MSGPDEYGIEYVPAADPPPPTKPYKALVSAAVAAVGVLVAQGSDVLPAWALLVLAAVLAGGLTYVVPNPPAD